MRRWVATFNAVETYGLYINRLKKADLLLGNEPSWRNTEIETIPNGLINAQDKCFSFTNFVQPGDISRTMERENHSALARAAYISYLFPHQRTFGDAPTLQGGVDGTAPQVAASETKGTNRSPNLRMGTGPCGKIQISQKTFADGAYY